MWTERLTGKKKKKKTTKNCEAGEGEWQVKVEKGSEAATSQWTSKIAANTLELDRGKGRFSQVSEAQLS